MISDYGLYDNCSLNSHMMFLDKSQIVVWPLNDGAMVSQILWLGVKDVFTQITKDVVGQGLPLYFGVNIKAKFPGVIRVKMAYSHRKRYSALGKRKTKRFDTEPVRSQLRDDCMLGCDRGEQREEASEPQG
ncbi:hypothetical protein F2Q69_00007312 [Brassica cretica]|uniref:Uncharacterized protein n=1 Tax=Brassica cretica TaxID=69181 RepID=A0A8S9P2B6_BRACR|nr:hypothetical protein F2Q69_00007312 [Brassica cretica]